MRRSLSDLKAEGVECDNCGLGKGTRTDHGVRCDDCGQFAETSGDYCGEHGVNLRRLTGYDHCPACREIQRAEAERQEMMQRRADPQMHNSVDAPRF